MNENQNLHKENLQRWYDLYTGIIRESYPILYPQIVVQWNVCDNVIDRGIESDYIDVRMEKDISCRWGEDLPRKKYGKGVKELRNYNGNLKEIEERISSSIPLHKKTKYSKGKYIVPLNDLPEELQKERIQLLTRSQGIGQVEKMIREAQGSLGISPKFFENEDNTLNLRTKLNFLEDAREIVLSVNPATFSDDLIQHQDRILTYLGLPIDVPHRPKAGPLGNNNPGIYVMKSWYWPGAPHYDVFDHQILLGRD